MRRTIVITAEQVVRSAGKYPAGQSDRFLIDRFMEEGISITGANDPRLAFESLDPRADSAVEESLAYRVTFDDSKVGAA